MSLSNNDKKIEQILVVETQLLTPFLVDKGLITANSSEILDIISENYSFLPRPEAEEDPSFKQIIPYVVICREGKAFSTRRLNKGGESRLHGLISLGIGGHINKDEDDVDADVLKNGLMRELHEEVNITGPINLKFHGLINDDTNGVGSVHLGLFYTLETQSDVSVKETDKLLGEWHEISKLVSMTGEMETWSQIVLESL